MSIYETQKVNEVQISTYYDAFKGYVVQITIPGTPSVVRDHIYSTAAAAGEAIHGLKEFYRHFGM